MKMEIKNCVCVYLHEIFPLGISLENMFKFSLYSGLLTFTEKFSKRNFCLASCPSSLMPFSSHENFKRYLQDTIIN